MFYMLAKPLYMCLVCLMQVSIGHILKLNPLDLIYIKKNTSNIFLRDNISEHKKIFNYPYSIENAYPSKEEEKYTL